MEQIFEALKGIIVRAIPTFVLVILLHWYLKKVLFEPMQRVLEERRKKTEGAVEGSEAALASVNEKLAGYEKALGDARAAIYQEQEAARKQLSEQQAAAVEAARAKSAAQIAEFKAGLATEVAAAKSTLEAQSEELAERIAGAVLAGRAL